MVLEPMDSHNDRRAKVMITGLKCANDARKRRKTGREYGLCSPRLKKGWPVHQFSQCGRGVCHNFIKYMKKTLLLFIGFMGLVMAAAAQTTLETPSLTPGSSPGAITGTIRDSSSNRPLEKAVVSYVETGKTDTLRALTDAKGRFSINATPAGEFILIISNVGFQTKGRRFPATMAGEVGLIQLAVKIK